MHPENAEPEIKKKASILWKYMDKLKDLGFDILWDTEKEFISSFRDGSKCSLYDQFLYDLERKILSECPSQEFQQLLGKWVMIKDNETLLRSIVYRTNPMLFRIETVQILCVYLLENIKLKQLLAAKKRSENSKEPENQNDHVDKIDDKVFCYKNINFLKRCNSTFF